MPKYIVRVTYSYPVGAVNAEEALATVPTVIQMRFAGIYGEGLTEIVNASTNEVVLTAKLNPDKAARSR